MPRPGETGAIWPFTAIGEMDRVAADRICIVVTHDPRVMERCSQVYCLNTSLQLLVD